LLVPEILSVATAEDTVSVADGNRGAADPLSVFSEPCAGKPVYQAARFSAGDGDPVKWAK